jgi:hypothetical protein
MMTGAASPLGTLPRRLQLPCLPEPNLPRRALRGALKQGTLTNFPGAAMMKNCSRSKDPPKKHPGGFITNPPMSILSGFFSSKHGVKPRPGTIRQLCFPAVTGPWQGGFSTNPLRSWVGGFLQLKPGSRGGFAGNRLPP